MRAQKASFLKFITIVSIIILTFISSCNLIPKSIRESGLLGPTDTPTLTSTPSPTATPTPTPTPVPAVRVDQADWLLFSGQYDEALQEYTLAFSQATDAETQAAALTGIGHSQYLKKDYTAAIQALTTVTENYQATAVYPTALFLLGEVFLAQLRNAEAAATFQQYLDAKPGVLNAYVQELRGDALTAAGDLNGALAAYEAAFASDQISDPVFQAVKVGQTYVTMGDHENALRTFMGILNSTNNDYIKAQMNYLAGQEYLALGMTEQAFARFQESLINYPRSYYAYAGLVVLVENDVPVDDYQRAKVDYYAGQYSVAAELFNRYIKENPDHPGEAHHFYALSLNGIGQYDAAINEWDNLIRDHPDDTYFASAWDEKSWTQWNKLGKYDQAAQTLLDFVARYSTRPEAPTFLFYAARIQEDNNQISDAAVTFERIINEYPTAEDAYRALFLAGIDHYRTAAYAQALQVFQRVLVLGTNAADQAMAQFWIGKVQQKQNNTDAAQEAFNLAASLDPGSYYSERAREVLAGLQPLQSISNYSTEYDLSQERILAEGWLRTTFTLPTETDLSGLGALAQDARMQRAIAFWEVGLFTEARQELEDLRAGYENDAVATYLIMNWALDHGFYRTAIFASRQVLTLAGMNDDATFTAPLYFNHIRFGAYFSDLVESAAEEEGLHPYLLYSSMRQESMFEGFVYSSAGARGLLQIMPDTGAEIAGWIGWPVDFTADDLYRPNVSIRLGARYLSRQSEEYGGALFGLAAYNAGPGNAYFWKQLSGDDPDLFFEVIDIEETRQYIQQICEFYHIYQRLYDTGS
jgi:soluble lytic murein transglycosylase